MKTHPFIFWTHHLTGVLLALVLIAQPNTFLTIIASLVILWYAKHDVRLK